MDTDKQPVTVLVEPLPPPSVTPMALLDRAIEKGISPDQLGKLIDLAEGWRKARAAEAFAVALSNAQKAMPAIVKDKTNSQTKSKYARLETVNLAAIPVYTQEGMSLSFSEEDSPKPGHLRIVCDVLHRDGHGKRYHLDMPLAGLGIQGNRAMTETHGAGATISYARRYLTCMIFNLAITDEDTDGNAPTTANPYVTQEQLGWLAEMLKITMIPGPDLADWLEVGQKEVSKIKAADFPKAAAHLQQEAKKLKKPFPAWTNGKGGPQG